MIRAALLALVALLLVACGSDPAGGGATLEQASVVVMGERLAEDNETVEQYPACMGVAVAPDRVVTSDHCEAGLIDGVHVVVDAYNWAHTSDGNVLADTVSVKGEVRTLVPRKPLGAWMATGVAVDGDAVLVVPARLGSRGDIASANRRLDHGNDRSRGQRGRDRPRGAAGRAGASLRLKRRQGVRLGRREVFGAMTARVVVLVLGFTIGIGMLSAGAWLSNPPPKTPCPCPPPPDDASVPVSAP